MGSVDYIGGRFQEMTILDMDVLITAGQQQRLQQLKDVTAILAGTD